VKRLWRVARLYPALLRVGLAEAIAYRAEFLIWMLTNTLPLVMLALWAAVAREAPVGRFDSTEFVAYFLGALIVRMLTGAWVVWEIIMEVRQGTLAQRLLRPIHPVLAYSAQNLAAVPLRVVVALPIALVLFVSAAGERVTAEPALLAIFALSLIGGWLLNFLSMVAIGTLAFFLESALGIFGLWWALLSVFSGYIVPLELFPEWLSSAVQVLPFRFMVSFPVEALTGQLSPERALGLLAGQWGWVAAFWVIAAVSWRVGMRRFAAYGG
jgi:ABC-2 type transport system permease protein